MRIEFLYQNLIEPPTHRQAVASLITEIIRGTNFLLRNRILSAFGKEAEPFVFATFPVNRRQSDLRVTTRKVILSCFSPELFVHFYNALLTRDSIKDIYLHPLTRINRDSVIFRTLSPILVNTEERDWYLRNGIDDLIQELNLSAFRLSSSILGEGLQVDSFTPVRVARLAIRDTLGVVQGFEGIFKLKAKKELLNLINDVGLGRLRRNGFGMLEVVTGSRYDRENF